jgi:hypothetical protein
MAREDEDSHARSPLSNWKPEDSLGPSPRLTSTKEEPSAQAQEDPEECLQLRLTCALIVRKHRELSRQI